jgi:hypothetical protein
MPKYKIGDHVLVKLSGGRIVEATIKAVVTKTAFKFNLEMRLR